jgi:hypothetical protein
MQAICTNYPALSGGSDVAGIGPFPMLGLA